MLVGGASGCTETLAPDPHPVLVIPSALGQAVADEQDMLNSHLLGCEGQPSAQVRPSICLHQWMQPIHELSVQDNAFRTNVAHA